MGTTDGSILKQWRTGEAKRAHAVSTRQKSQRTPVGRYNSLPHAFDCFDASLSEPSTLTAQSTAPSISPPISLCSRASSCLPTTDPIAHGLQARHRPVRRSVGGEGGLGVPAHVAGGPRAAAAAGRAARLRQPLRALVRVLLPTARQESVHLLVLSTRENLREMFGQVGKMFGEAARKTEGIAGDVWQHLKTGPSITDAAMGRIAQISKVISEGGYDKIFQQTFECLPDEKLKKAYACYLSTSHGPIMGVLYVSTAKLAFCSDSTVAYVTEDNKTASAIYKVVIPVPHLRSVTPTASQQNPAERYIQVVSVDNHEFWFMGFVNYDSAVKCLQDAVRGSG